MPKMQRPKHSIDDSIYQREELLEIYKNPMNYGLMRDPTVQVEENNPMCGDNVILSLDVSSDGHIKDARFMGDMCAVAVISSAMVTDEIIGKTIEQAESLTKEELLNMMDVNLTTSRIKCATLILDALKKAIKELPEELPAVLDATSSASDSSADSTAGSIAKVTRDTNMADLIFRYPEAADVLTDYGLHCVGCFANSFDTIEMGAKIHGMTDAEVEEMIERVNEVVEFGE